MQRIVSFTKSMPNGKQAPVKRSTKPAAARNDALLDTRADGVPHGASRRPNRRPSQQPDILPPLSGGEHVTASSREGTRRHDGPMGRTWGFIRSAPQERNQ